MPNCQNKVQAVVLIDSIGTPFYLPLNHESPLACKNLLTSFFLNLHHFNWRIQAIVCISKFLLLNFQMIVLFLFFFIVEMLFSSHTNENDEWNMFQIFRLFKKKSMSTHIIYAPRWYSIKVTNDHKINYKRKMSFVCIASHFHFKTNSCM